MKRHGCLYKRITALSNICLAHKNARKGKTHYQEVKHVDKNENSLLKELQSSLINQTFTTAPYKTKKIYEPKERTIYVLPYYPDRVVQHAVMNITQPIWDKLFIYDLYSAIPGKGIHKAVDRVQAFLSDHKNTTYCLQFDIKSYYPSMRHDILLSLIKRKIKCKETLWLLEDVINSIPGEKNVPIGNYLSQYFGNIYLSCFDHWIKENKKIKYYLRYNDDGIILHNSKTFLWSLYDEIKKHFNDRLQLKLNPKTSIYPVDKQGIDFLGYRTFRNHRLLRRRSANKFKKKIIIIKQNHDKMTPQHIVSSIMSYVGWLEHGNCFNLMKKHLLEDAEIMKILDLLSLELGYVNPLRMKYRQYMM